MRDFEVQLGALGLVVNVIVLTQVAGYPPPRAKHAESVQAPINKLGGCE